MSALQNEIDKLKTLQESFDELSSKVLDTQAVLTELNHGKQEMVDAIKSKGATATTDNTLSELADKVRRLSFENFNLNGMEFDSGVIPKSLSELLANKDDIIKIDDDVTTTLAVDGGLGNLAKLESVSMANCETVAKLQFQNDTLLKEVSMPKVKNLSCDTFKGCTSLKKLYLSGVERISAFLSGDAREFIKAPNLQELNIKNLIRTDGVILISGETKFDTIRLEHYEEQAWRDLGGVAVNTTLFKNSSLRIIEMPKFSRCVGDNYNHIITDSNIIERVQVGRLESGAINVPFCPNLLDIEIGENIQINIMFRWTPSSAYDNPDKAAILNENIRNHIIAKLPDLSNETPKTITFYNSKNSSPNTDLVNILEQETMDAFAAKNWNISPAKSV